MVRFKKVVLGLSFHTALNTSHPHFSSSEKGDLTVQPNSKLYIQSPLTGRNHSAPKRINRCIPFLPDSTVYPTFLCFPQGFIPLDSSRLVSAKK